MTNNTKYVVHKAVVETVLPNKATGVHESHDWVDYDGEAECRNCSTRYLSNASTHHCGNVLPRALHIVFFWSNETVTDTYIPIPAHWSPVQVEALRKLFDLPDFD